MRRWMVERRLRQASERLRRARAELAVVEEQLVSFAETADETRVRALVSEDPAAPGDHRDAERHAAAMRRTQTSLRRTVEELEQVRDDLLDRLGSLPR